MRFTYLALAIACLTVQTTLSQETPDPTDIGDSGEVPSLTLDTPAPTPTGEAGDSATDPTTNTSITNGGAFSVSFNALTMTSPGTYVTVVNGNTISVIVYPTNTTKSATATSQVSPTTSRKSSASRDYIPGTLAGVALMGIIGVLVGTV